MPVIFLDGDANDYIAAPLEVVYGGGGNDTLRADPGGSLLQGDLGDDVLLGGAGADYLIGDSDNTVVTLAHNVLKGFGGNDVIQSNSWFDQIDAGSGNDVVFIQALTTNQIVQGGTGFDGLVMQAFLQSNASVNITLGTTFAVFVNGVKGATYTDFEVLTYFGGTGATTITAGSGNDVLSVGGISGFFAGFLHGAGGDDTISFGGLPLTGVENLDGGAGHDRLTWSQSAANSAAIVVDVATGTMSVGGVIFANFAAFEAVAISTGFFNTGSVTFNGGATDDSAEVWGSTSLLQGRAGDDAFAVHSGNATVSGGAGDDVLTGDQSAHVLIHGDTGNDALIASSAAGDYFGDAGDDDFTARLTVSHLFGGGGDDAFDVTASTTTGGVIDGGSGHDVLVLTSPVTFAALHANFARSQTTLADGTIVRGFEAVDCTGGFGNDTLTASNDAGGALLNWLAGYNGDDVLKASANGARLNGEVGNDTLTGAAGADVLIDWAGADVMKGNGGADSFNFAFGVFIGTAAGARDIIVDFSHAEGDQIDLTGIDANATLLDDQAFHFIKTAAFGHHAGELRYEVFDNAGTANDFRLVSGDTNGDGIADFNLQLTGLHVLFAADFNL